MRKVVVDDYNFSGYESITVGNAAVGFTNSLYLPTDKKIVANVVECRLESANIRYRLDGTNPTSTEGILLQAGEILILKGNNNITRFRAVKTGGVSGTIKVHYGW